MSNELNTNALGGISLLERRRAMMGGRKEYVNIYKSLFPSNGLVSNRQIFFIYLSETVEVGTKIHMATAFTSMDASTTSLAIKDSAASPNNVVIPMPQDRFDVEFEVSQRDTNVLYCYFDKNVTNVQIDTSSIIVEKII